jgi:outer membrane protein
MKKLLCSLVLIFCAFGMNAQRAAYVDMDKLMESVPDYKTAQQKLEQAAEKWRQEIAQERSKLDQMTRAYETKAPLMSDDMRKAKQKEIEDKEKSIRTLQMKRFGPNGELFQKRQSLVKPVQEKVFKAIKQIAEQRRFDFVFSSPDGGSIIYAADKVNITAAVIKKIKK